MAVSNPLYPGYYPGDPIIREPPAGRGSQIQPSSFDADVIREEIENLELELPDIPQVIKDRLIADIKTEINPIIYSGTSNVTAADIAAHDQEETQELPGSGGITVSLYPGDWIKDPKKQLTKTAKDWLKASFDWEDVDGRVRVKVWEDLLSYSKAELQNQVRDPNFRRTGLEAADIEALEEKTLAYANITGMAPSSGGNPLKLLQKVYDPKTGEDLGVGVVGKIKAFEDNLKTNVTRDQNSDAMLMEIHKVIKEDLTQRMGASAIAADAKTAADIFIAEEGLVEDITKMSNSLVGSKKDGGLTPFLSEHRMEGSGNLDIAAGLDNVRDQIKKSRDSILHLRETDNLGRNRLGLSALQLKELEEGVLKPYEAMLDEVARAIKLDEATGVIGIATNVSATEAGALSRQLTSIASAPGILHRGMIKGDALRQSPQRKLLRIMTRDVVQDGGSNVLEGTFGGSYGFIGSVKRSLPLLMRQRWSQEVNEVLDAVTEGKVIQTYIWRRIKARLSGYTPDFYAGYIVKKANYFGLKIDGPLDTNVHLNGAGKIFEPIINLSNSFIKKSGLFENRFKISLGGNVLKLRGGDHFRAVEPLHALLVRNKDFLDKAQASGNALNPALANLVILDQAKLQQLVNFIRVGDTTGAAGFLQGLGLFNGSNDQLGDINKFVGQFKDLIDWIRVNGARYGITNIDQNFTLFVQFIHRLHVYSTSADALGVGVDKAFRGALIKIGQLISKANTAILNSFAGKLIKGAINLKNVLVNKIASRLVGQATKAAIAAALGVSTAFVGTVIAWAVERVLKKLWDGAKAVFKVIYETNLDALDEFLEESARGMTKPLTTCIGVLAFTTICLFFFISVIAGAISPHNPSKGSGGPIYDFGLTKEVEPQGPFTGIASCPLRGGYLTLGSYNGPGSSGHGSQAYWRFVQSIGGNMCYSIPSYLGVSPRSAPDMIVGYCAGTATVSPFYGYAADYSSSDHSVYAPDMGGTWMGTIGQGGAGKYVLLSNSSYTIVILHLNISSALSNGPIEPGTYLGEMWDGWPGGGNEHIHVEVKLSNGTIVRPENGYVVCN